METSINFRDPDLRYCCFKINKKQLILEFSSRDVSRDVLSSSRSGIAETVLVCSRLFAWSEQTTDCKHICTLRTQTLELCRVWLETSGMFDDMKIPRVSYANLSFSFSISYWTPYFSTGLENTSGFCDRNLGFFHWPYVFCGFGFLGYVSIYIYVYSLVRGLNSILKPYAML